MTLIVRNLCLLSSLLTLSLVGCTGGTGGGGGGGGGGGTGADSGIAPGRDGGGGELDAGGPTSECPEVADFGDVGVLDGALLGNGVTYLSVDGALGDNDLYIIELYEGFGPFAGGLTTGTFQITGDETDYNLCGACVGIYANNDPANGPEMVYVAQSGTLEITSIEENFTGSFTPAGGSTTYVGFAVEGEELVRNDSCTVSGGGASWNAAIPETKNPSPGN